MIYDLVPCDHPILHTKLDKFDFTNPPVNPVELANNLIETMVKNNGMGLAANQCGLPHRVFVLYSQESLACYNPSVVDVSTETVLLEEGCLSFPNLLIPIKRPKTIKVRFFDPFGVGRTEKFSGITARAFLHELDHLDGIDYTTKANRIHLDRARRKQKMLDRFTKKQERLAI